MAETTGILWIDSTFSAWSGCKQVFAYCCC